MNELWETRVQTTAKAFPYPPTPDIAARLRPQRRRIGVRRVAQIAAVLLIALVATLMAVPEIRAQVLALFHIGAVEVIVTTATPPAQFNGGDLPASVLDFPGATTLDDARQHFGYPIPLPSALGVPDRVYLIQALHPIVVLAWLDSGGAVDLSLHLLPTESYALKMTSGTPQPEQVNGADALWIPGSHGYMLMVGPDQPRMRTVPSSALVWQAADGITYRLETNRSLDDALRVANSIPVGNG